MMLRRIFRVKNIIAVEKNWNKKVGVKIELNENIICNSAPMIERFSAAFEEILLSISIKTNRIII